MEKLIAINLDDSEYSRLQKIAGRMRLKAERLECSAGEDYNAALEEIASGKYKEHLQSDDKCGEHLQSGDKCGGHLQFGDKCEEYKNQPKDDRSLILICGLSEKRLDKVLFELRRAEVSADFKAVLTPTNKNWTLRRLFAELSRERAVMEKR